MPWYHVALENSTETVCLWGQGAVEKPIGSGLIAFLDADWDAWHKKAAPYCDDHDKAQESVLDFKAFYGELKERLGTLHPLLQTFVEDQLPGAWCVLAMDSVCATDLDFVAALRDVKEPEVDISGHMLYRLWNQTDSYFTHFAQFREKLEPMMDAVLNTGVEEELPQIQRYCLMRKTSPDYTVLAKDLYDSLALESAVVLNGQIEEFLPNSTVTDDFMAQVQDGQLSVHTFQTTDHLDAILLWELDYMASHGRILRRCDHCGRYFIPYSNVNCYCNRPTAERPDKTCKQIGAMTKHQAQVNGDAAKKLYTQRNNSIHLWATRHQKQYPHALDRNYRAWNLRAMDMRDMVMNGEMSYEEFEAAMQGDPKTLLGL